MRYVQVIWHHQDPVDPVLFFSEVDESNGEVRKVEVGRDGVMAWASEEVRGEHLAEVPFSSVEEINGDPESESTAFAITLDAFEAMWNAATGRTGSPGRADGYGRPSCD